MRMPRLATAAAVFVLAPALTLTGSGARASTALPDPVTVRLTAPSGLAPAAARFSWLDIRALSTQPCAGGKINLHIPDRDEEAGAPPEGWCGEACIQMALIHYGLRVSQKAINKAGHPKGHPDLWDADIVRALHNLGATDKVWPSSSVYVRTFIVWVTNQLRAHHPVITGVKLYPDENPTWNVDHYVLVVGCSTSGLLINTNNAGDGQIWVTYRELTSLKGTYSFANKFKKYFGCAVTGLR